MQKCGRQGAQTVKGSNECAVTASLSANVSVGVHGRAREHAIALQGLPRERA